jgi:hypothetical protein
MGRHPRREGSGYWDVQNHRELFSLIEKGALPTPFAAIGGKSTHPKQALYVKINHQS